MGKSNFAEQIRNKETYLGIEFGSTRIKAVWIVVAKSRICKFISG